MSETFLIPDVRKVHGFDCAYPCNEGDINWNGLAMMGYDLSVLEPYTGQCLTYDEIMDTLNETGRKIVRISVHDTLRLVVAEGMIFNGLRKDDNGEMVYEFIDQHRTCSTTE